MTEQSKETACYEVLHRALGMDRFFRMMLTSFYRAELKYSCY